MGEAKKLSKDVMSGNVPDSAGSHRANLAVSDAAMSVLTESRVLCSGPSQASANSCPEHVNSQEPPSLLPTSWKGLWVLHWQENHTEVSSDQEWSKRPKESGRRTNRISSPHLTV